MTSRQYHAIDERVAAEIRRLHKRHPKLGHDGLLDALRQESIHVDPQDLDRFMKINRIRPERPWWRLGWRGVSRYFVGHQFVHGRLKGQFEKGDFEELNHD
jgi:hypothetical protein